MKTQVTRFALVCALGTSSVAGADAAAEAQASLSKAYNEYSKALSENPKMTPAQRAELHKRLMEPARAAVHNAIRSQTPRTLENEPPMPSLVDKWKGNPPPSGKPVSEVKPVAPKPQASPEATAAPAPQVELDGKGIPKEIEFRGRR